MSETTAAPAQGTSMLDRIERLGNRVPHPVMMFVYLIIGVAVISHVLYLFDVSVVEEVAVPVQSPGPVDEHGGLGGSDVEYPLYPDEPDYVPDYEIVEQEITVESLLTTDGIRFVLTSFVDNFAAFAVVAVIFVAMMGVGVAEEAGLMAALIRKMVAVAPRGVIAFILIFVGVLSSVASDAGYLILIPLAAAAFATLGRHPLAGLAAAFAGVGAVFGVNIVITPIDSMLTEITNEAIGLTSAEPITVTANFFFSAVSAVVIALVAMVVTQRIIEPRLGPWGGSALDAGEEDQTVEEQEAEARGLSFALYALVAIVVLILIATLPPGSPLRHPETGEVIGSTPFMESLIFLITLIFLACGIFYGIGARTITNSSGVIAAVTKTFSGLAGLVFMLLLIAQFIAYFNFTNIPRVAAAQMAGLLERANIPALALLVLLIVVILVLDIILPGVVPKWAIFAPVFIPIFVRLGITPQTVLAAYRIGDSPTNVITPLMVYLPFIVTVAQRYQKDAGLGTVVALMLPYTLFIALAWVALFVLWFLLGLPLGPGYPVSA